MSDFKRIFRELCESGGIADAKDLVTFVDSIAGLESLRRELDAWKDRFRAIVGDDSPDGAGNAVITLQTQLAAANEAREKLGLDAAKALGDAEARYGEMKERAEQAVAAANEARDEARKVALKYQQLFSDADTAREKAEGEASLLRSEIATAERAFGHLRGMFDVKERELKQAVADRDAAQGALCAAKNAHGDHWEGRNGNVTECSTCAALAKAAPCPHAERVKVLEEALFNQLSDLHEGSNRPCDTCRKSAEALGLAIPNRCPRIHELAELMGRRRASGGK